nr:unnamed protein product [Callosobruchus chinensis]
MLFLVETKISESAPTNHLKFPKYECHSSLRKNGGVMAFVRSNLSCSRVPALESGRKDILWLKLNLKPFPKGMGDLGDFNVHNEAWLGFNKTDAAGRAVEAFALSQGLTQLVKEPTFFPRVASHSTSLLDLFLTTHPVSYTIDVQSPLGNSDHGLVEVKFPSATDVSAEIHPSRKIWHYGDADWDGLRDFFSSFPWNDVCFAKHDVSTVCSEVTEVILVGMEAYIPHTTKTFKPGSNGWFNKSCDTARRLILRRETNTTEPFSSKQAESQHDAKIKQKAFDQLWHASLLNKLPSYGLPVKLCDWLADFLSGRKITVEVDGFSSSFHNINAGVPQGSVLAPTLFLLHINDLLSSTTNPIHSFADDSTLHAGIMSNRLATAASLSKDLEAITAWGLENMVEFNASKTQYCTLSNKRCPSEHSVLMNNQALPRSHSCKLLGVSITENMIWHEHVSSIATATGKKLGYLFRARKYFSPSNLLTLYKAQIRPSLEYCSHIWGAAAPTTLSILDAVQRRAIRLIGDLALTCHLQPLSHRRAPENSRAMNCDEGLLELAFGGLVEKFLNRVAARRSPTPPGRWW